MEMKNVVLTAAIALACSAFADTVKQSWFNHTPENGTFDTELNDPPSSVSCPGAPESGVAVYRIIATINDLKVFATTPTDGPAQVDSKPANASICAIGSNWYYYNGSGWSVLESLGPAEDAAYTITVEFSGSSVTYKVKKGEETATSQTVSGVTPFVPSAFAFAGTGAYSSVVCEYEVTIPANSSGVQVDNEGGKIIISNAALEEIGAENVQTAKGNNDLKKWVNYVLGLSNTDANAKPFAAPAQNADSGKLTFNLGGVSVLGETATGAKVTYTVESRVGLNGVWTNAVNDEYKADNAEFDNVAVPAADEVKYYRIKIKIDPAKQD